MPPGDTRNNENNWFHPFWGMESVRIFEGVNSMIKALVFDIGGVLAYDIWEYLLPAIASQYNLDNSQVMKVGERLVPYSDKEVIGKFFKKWGEKNC